MEDINSQAFCLRTRAFGESDLIAVLLTEDFGKVSGVARGARRSKKRFAGGALEPFHQLHLRFARRPHTDLAFLHESRVVASHHAIAADLDAFAWASYLCELTEIMIPERDPCPDVFGLFAVTMNAFANRDPSPAAAEAGEPPLEALAHHFIMGMLANAGWGPDLERCAVCDGELEESVRPILDPRGGGIICTRHVAERMGENPEDPNFNPGRRIIDPDLLDYVRTCRMGPPIGAGTDTAKVATALLNRLIDIHVQRPLKSRTFLAQVGSAMAPAPDSPKTS